MTRKATRNRWRFLKQFIFRSLFRSQLTRFSVSPRRMRVESLEDRRLLALSPISVPEAAALRDTAAAIGGFSARLEDLGAFAKKLPLQQTSIGDLVDIDAAFAESFITPIQIYLAPTTANPTVEGLQGVVEKAIADLPQLTGSVSESIRKLELL